MHLGETPEGLFERYIFFAPLLQRHEGKQIPELSTKLETSQCQKEIANVIPLCEVADQKKLFCFHFPGMVWKHT